MIRFDLIRTRKQAIEVHNMLLCTIDSLKDEFQSEAKDDLAKLHSMIARFDSLTKVNKKAYKISEQINESTKRK